ncbi:MAG TPA: PsiF family protein [Roseiarcus sp.]|jgi:hypothetical protein|nr:PsiF family protein [Roseiarcus sp.]
MKLSALASVAIFAVALSAGAAIAQTTAPAPAAGATTPAARSAKSIECSKEADAKGLHGSERKKFRAECKKGKM